LGISSLTPIAPITLPASAGLDLVLELPLRPLVDRSALRLADADRDARHLRIVEPVEQDEV